MGCGASTREWVDLGGRQSAVPPWADFEAVGGVFMKGRDELFFEGGGCRFGIRTCREEGWTYTCTAWWAGH